MKKVGILFLLSLIFITPLVLAYNGLGYGYGSITEIFQNEIFIFGLVFIIFFAMIYFGLQKTFSDNKTIPAIIALVISIFIAASLSKYIYFGAVENLAIILAVLIAIFFLIKIIRDSNMGIGGIFLGIFVILLVLIITNFDPYNILPWQFYDLYYSLLIQEPNKWVTLIIVGVISLVVFFATKKPRRRSRYDWSI